MSIPKISSQDLNDIMIKAKEEITSIENKMDNIKNDLFSKIKIMGYEADYINREISNLKNGSYIRSNNLKTFNKFNKGVYNLYGSTITPDFIKSPINLFNMQTATSGEVFFRNDVTVSINGSTSKFNSNILKHDSLLDKQITFYELDNNELTLEITMDSQNQLGPAKFNMIELDPFLPGSFDIETMSIFYKDQDGVSKVAPRTYNNIKAIGKQRISLGTKYDFYKVIFKIKLNYVVNKSGKNIYPFGLKHIYFYDADFKNNSYIITNIDRQQYISIIKDEIYVVTSTGEFISTIDKENIEVYSTYKDGEFEDRIYASTVMDRNEIARNINNLYIKIPLKPNQSLIGIGFYVETKNKDYFFNSNDVVYIDRVLKGTELEGPYYSKTVPHDIISIPSTPKQEEESQKEKAPAPIYNTLPSFGKNNNLFEHRVDEGFVLHSSLDIPFDDSSINSDNIYMIKTNSNKKVPLIFDNDKEHCNINIKSVYPLDYDCEYSIYFKKMNLVNGSSMPNYKAVFTTEDYEVDLRSSQHFIPTTDYKIKVQLDFEPDKDYLNEKFIFIVDKNSNKIITNAEYINGYLILSSKAKLQENQRYSIYIKKGIRNTKQKKTLVKTIKQLFFTGTNEYEKLPDKLFVPLKNSIDIKFDKVIDMSLINSQNTIDNFVYILDDENNKIQSDLKININDKILTLTPNKPLKNNCLHRLIINQDTPITDSPGAVLNKTIAQNIYTRNENLKVQELIDTSSNLDMGRFSIPTDYKLKLDLRCTVNEKTLNENTIVVLDSFYNKIEYNLNLFDSSKVELSFKELKKDSRYYVVLTNELLNLNGDSVIDGLKIISLITENSGVSKFTDLFIVPNDKIFNVDMSSIIGQECLNNKYVYVIDSNNKLIPTLINQPSNGSLSIKPPDNSYKYSEQYTVVVDKFIKDAQGIALLKPKTQKFTIIDDPTEIEYESIKSLNNNHVFNIEMEGNIAEKYLNTNYVYIVDNEYKKVKNINISYGNKDGITLSNVIRIAPVQGTTYPTGNLKLVISKDIKFPTNIKRKTKIIMFTSISPI